MEGMATYVIPQSDILGLRAGKPYLAVTSNANHAMVYGDDHFLYTIDRVHDERFMVIEMNDEDEKVSVDEAADREDAMFTEICDLEAVIIAMAKEKYLGG